MKEDIRKSLNRTTEQFELLEKQILIAEFLGGEIKVYSQEGAYIGNVEVEWKKDYQPPFSNIENAQFHKSLPVLFYVLNEIADNTGYELIISSGYSYWNKFGDNPLEKEFEGYSGGSEAIFEAIVELLKFLKK